MDGMGQDGIGEVEGVDSIWPRLVGALVCVEEGCWAV